MTARRVLVTIICTALAVFGFAGPADAHATSVYQGADYGTVSSTHASGYVYDKECDGNTVYIVVFSSNGFAYTWDDTNGCTTGGSRWAFNSGVTAKQIQVCERIGPYPNGCGQIINV